MTLTMRGWSRFTVLLVAFASLAYAQGTITLTGPATARPGTTVTAAVAIAGTPLTAAGYQWTLAAPVGWTLTAAAGAASTAATKQIACGATGICLVYGLNQNAIAAGQLATYQIQIPPAANHGTVQMPLSGVLGATATGNSVTLAVGATYSLLILARSDLDGDGVTNIADVQTMASQVTGGASCSSDQNGDGKCDLVDVLLVILAALGV